MPSLVVLPRSANPDVSGDGLHPRVPLLLDIFSPFWSFPATSGAVKMVAQRPSWNWASLWLLLTFSLSYSIQVNRVMTYRDLDNDLMKYAAFQTLVSRTASAQRGRPQGVSQLLQSHEHLHASLRLPGSGPFAGGVTASPHLVYSSISQCRLPLLP